MILDLRFSNRPLEDLWCEAVCALVFQRSDMLSGAISGLNRKLAGYLGNLLERNLLTGARGENYLIATTNIFQADKLILHGMGREEELTKTVLKDEITLLGNSLDKLGLREIGIHVPVPYGRDKDYCAHLEISAAFLTDVFYQKHRYEQELLLKIIFSVDDRFTDKLDLTINRLRKHFNPMHKYTIIKDRKSRGGEIS